MNLSKITLFVNSSKQKFLERENEDEVAKVLSPERKLLKRIEFLAKSKTLAKSEGQHFFLCLRRSNVLHLAPVFCFKVGNHQVCSLSAEEDCNGSKKRHWISRQVVCF